MAAGNLYKGQCLALTDIASQMAGTTISNSIVQGCQTTGTANQLLCSYRNLNNSTGTFQISFFTCPVAVSYDYDAMAQFWFFGLSIIVAFFVLGRGAGVVLDVFRK